MNDKPTAQEFHRRLLKDVFSGPVSDTDAMLLFHLLHNYEIHLPENTIENWDKTFILALTQRGAADAIAGLWADSDDPRNDYTHWYGEWQRQDETLTEEHQERLVVLKQKIENHPWVTEMTLEE